MLNNLPIVYNLNKNEWTDNYDANEVERNTPIGAIVGGIVGVLIVGAGIGLFLYKRQQRKKEENAAYYNDAMAAAAITNGEDDDNIKVLADDSYSGYEHSGYGGYGNDYPLNNVGAGSPPGSEKYSNPYSPSATYYAGAVIGTPVILTPSPAHIAHQNPFISPEDYHPPASNIQDPYLQYQHSPKWPATNYVGASDGSKIVLYGGTPDGVNYFNTIYILDVKSGKWTQAWGGSSGGPRATMLNNLPI
ncbi:hypothetical protein BGX26_008029, partial [Mortierella sp. AD094]